MKRFLPLLSTACCIALFSGCTVSTHSQDTTPERTSMEAMGENASQAKEGFLGILEGTTKLIGGTSALVGDLVLQPFGLDGPISSKVIGGALIGAGLGGNAGEGALIGAGVGAASGAAEQYIWQSDQDDYLQPAYQAQPTYTEPAYNPYYAYPY